MFVFKDVERPRRKREKEKKKKKRIRNISQRKRLEKHMESTYILLSSG